MRNEGRFPGEANLTNGKKDTIFPPRLPPVLSMNAVQTLDGDRLYSRSKNNGP